MKKIVAFLIAVFIIFTANVYCQTTTKQANPRVSATQAAKKDAKTNVNVVKTDAKTQVQGAKTETKTQVKDTKTESKTQVKEAKTVARTQVKAAESDKSGQSDKVITGLKGPDGQPVYEGIRGGQYYINKSGNKTYLKAEDNVVPGKKGPEGQPVYVGPKGGQYYINKSGVKTYVTPEKK